MIVAFIIAATILIGLTSVIGKTMMSAAAGSSPSPIGPPDTASSGNSRNDTGAIVSNSDQSLTGGYITQDPSTWPGPSGIYTSVAVWNICTAVAFAEGFDRGPGTAPYDLNNPGDLSPGDENGQAVIGQPQFHSGSYIIQFATVESGFIALYIKFARIISGKSTVYPVNWTWEQVARKYAGDWQNWLNNVTSYLGVDPNSTPASYRA